METGKTTKSLENNDFFTAGQSGCDGEGAIAKHSPGENIKKSKKECFPVFETSSAVKESPNRKLQYSLSLTLQVGMIHVAGIIMVKMSRCVHIEIQLNTELISIFVVMYFYFDE